MPLERCDEHHVNNVSHTDTFLKSSYSNSVSLDNYPYILRSIKYQIHAQDYILWKFFYMPLLYITVLFSSTVRPVNLVQNVIKTAAFCDCLFTQVAFYHGFIPFIAFLIT